MGFDGLLTGKLTRQIITMHCIATCYKNVALLRVQYHLLVYRTP